MLARLAAGLGPQLAADERGATAIEYGLIAALIAALLAGTFVSVGNAVDTTFQKMEDAARKANS